MGCWRLRLCLFLLQAMNDALDEVSERAAGNGGGNAEQRGSQHGVKKFRAAGLGKLNVGIDCARFGGFVPGVSKFFGRDVEVGRERDVV